MTPFPGFPSVRLGKASLYTSIIEEILEKCHIVFFIKNGYNGVSGGKNEEVYLICGARGYCNFPARGP